MPNRFHLTRIVCAAAAILLAVVLAGCELVIPNLADPPRLYRLTPKSTFPPDLYPANFFNGDFQEVDWQLVVEPPAAPASINTDRIGLLASEHQLTYYANANWVDRAPVMVQQLLIESFDSSGRVKGVGSEADGLRPDFVLRMVLREFQAHVVGESETCQCHRSLTSPEPLRCTAPTVSVPNGWHCVNVELNARLVQMPERRIVDVAGFQRKVAAPPDKLANIIAAFDDGLGKVLKRLVVWSLVTAQSFDARSSSGSAAAVSARPTMAPPPTVTTSGRSINRLQRPPALSN